jgi:iron complex outermembrane recepter protein
MRKYLVLLITVLLPGVLSAQMNFFGKVYDKSSRKTLPGAHIHIPKINRTAISDQNGNFSILSLKEDSYSVQVSYLGYDIYTTTIAAAENNYMEIYLEPAAYLSEEVIVKASRAAIDAPLSYSNISREHIELFHTATDLPYLLQSTPSVVVTSDAGAGIGYTGIRIRGTDITRINVTMNGIPVNDPESHAVFFVNMPDLVSSVDNMQIQRGVGSSANGSAAFGASINIKTDPQTPDPYVSMNSFFGSYTSMRNTLKFGTGKSQSGFSLEGRLSKISSDGYIDRGWSDLKSFYLSGSWQTDKSLVKLLVTSGQEKTYQAWYGIPKDSLKTNRRYNPSGEMVNKDGLITGYYDNQTDNYQQDYYQLHLAHRFKTNVYLNASAFLTKGKGYYESWRSSEEFSNYGLPNLDINGTIIDRTDLIRQKWLDNDFYGFNTALHYDVGQTNIVLGTGWNKYLGDHFGHIVWATYTSTSTPKWNWYSNAGQKTDYHTYIRATHKLNNKISIYTDLQYRGIDYTISGTHDDLRDIGQNHHFSFFNPKAGLSVAISQNQIAYLSAGVSNREPNRSVYRDADEGQEISKEQLIDYEIGYKAQYNQLRLETNLYYMQYNNQLVLTGKINNVGAPILTNVPESYRAGIEVSLNYNFTKKLQFAGNIALSTNKIKNFTEFVDNWNYWDDPDNEPYQYQFDLGRTDISFSPTLVAGSILSYKLFEKSQITFSTNFVSRQYIDNTSTIDRSIDPYLVNNLSFTHSISIKHIEHFSLHLHLNNIFNEAYEGNAWVYRYIYDGEPYVLDGYFPQANFHWMLGLKVMF